VAQVRAMGLISNPDPTFKELGEVVDADPALTAALLRVANSAASSPVSRVSTARTAMVRIGADESRRLIMSVAVASSFGTLGVSGIDEGELWRHLIATALLADATAWGDIRQSEAFTAGILHDIGRLAMAAQEPVRYGEVVERARAGEPTGLAERAVFGLNHAEWGASIARSWGFPDEIAEAIAHHHTAEQHGLAWAVTRARELAASLGIGDGVTPAVPPDPDSEAALMPVIDELGGAPAVLDRVDRYSRALRAA
jgi:putative nucleotidyltransferase with HDIG domain